jgi:PAS domain S-box-containing protein
MIRLLLVDDEPLFLIVSKKFLEKDDSGIECDTCSSAGEALEKLAASSYDATVSDYDMPEMDGIALLKVVRAQYPDLPFILLTGRGREEVVIEALNHGADFYLQKSAEPRVLFAELASKIRHAVDRRRAREALQESEEKARAQLTEIEAIYTSAPVGLCLLGTDTRYLRVNEQFAEMNGFSIEDHLGKKVRELVPDVADAADELARTVVETGEPVLYIEIEGETPAQPGVQRYWKESWVPLKDALGRVRAINIVAEDITDSKRAEKELRQSQQSLAAELDTARRLHQVSTQLIQADRIEALYEQILDTAVMIMQSDFASIQMLYPERGTVGELLLLGYRGFTPEAARFWKWVRPDSESSCGKALRTRQRVIVPDIQHCEFLAGSADQETYLQTGIHAVQTTPLISRSGTLQGMISTHWRVPHEPTADELRSFDVLARQAADLIDRTRAEGTLRHQTEMFQRLIDTIPAMITIFDPKLQQFQFNRAFRDILGWTEEDAAKGDFMAMIYPDPAYRAQVSAFMQSLEPGWQDWKAKAKDGSIVESSWATIRLSDDTLIGIGIDLRERKNAEKSLKDANKKLNLLTSITRHDILNQVTALKAFLTLMQDPDYNEGEAMQILHQLDTIADTIRRQITFTGDYQDMGERKPEWQQVEWVVMRAAKSVRLNGAALAVDTGSLELFADPMLEKAFFNLLDNAVIHGDGVKNISISFRKEEGSGMLVVEDDGVGVPASSKDKIFERGFGKVTGYGLFLVKEILDITGMSIQESGAEEKGARFEIEVPAEMWRMTEH